MKLKELKEIKLSAKLEGKIKSGFKSGDSSEELLIVEPLIEHPEIKGLYRAFDPITGWKGWVEYVPPSPSQPPAPTPEELARQEFQTKYNQLQKMKRAIESGVIDSTNADFLALQTEVKGLYKPEYVDML